MNTRKIAALVLPLIFDAGTAHWTSEDEIKKRASDAKRVSDKFSELQAVNYSSRDADLTLEHNQHILAIIKETFAKRESTDGKTLHDVENQTKACGQDITILSGKEAAWEHAGAMAKEASQNASEARLKLDAANKVVAGKMSEKKLAEAALVKAQKHMEEAVQNVGSADVIAANRDENEKAAKLEAAEEELAHAEGSRKAKATALTEALAKNKSMAVAMQVAQKAYTAVAADLKSCNEELEKLVKQTGPILLGLKKLNQSVVKQAEAVRSMTLNSTSLHKKLHDTQDQYTKLRQTLKEDSVCIDDLQKLEGEVHTAAGSYNLTIAAYQAATYDNNLFDAAWETIDSLQNATYHYFLKQKECAPKGTDIPPKSPMASCPKDTGGSCHILWCDESRGAQCDRDTHACVCTGATCAKDGGCHSRGSPTTGLAKPAVLGQATTQAVTRASLDAGSLGVLVMIIAVLVAAAVVHRRRASRRVVLPTSLFG
jgi:hypothetical protein